MEVTPVSMLGDCMRCYVGSGSASLVGRYRSGSRSSDCLGGVEGKIGSRKMSDQKTVACINNEEEGMIEWGFLKTGKVVILAAKPEAKKPS